jgi:hypothetical protein
MRNQTMLTTLSILSPDQGKLSRKQISEDEYFARFSSAWTTSETPSRNALSQRTPKTPEWLSRVFHRAMRNDPSH